jgi:glycosyltransferase involved in cell wall biosynthesis
MARWNSANMSRYYHLFNKIADAGHAVIVVQPPSRPSEETNYIDLPMESHSNIKIYTVRMYEWLWNRNLPFDKFFKKALYTVGSFFTLRRLIREFKPDILVLYNLPHYLYTFGNKVPIVFDYADDYIGMFRHELAISNRHVLSRLSAAILRRLINKAALVTSVSDLLNSRVLHTNKLLLPNGADFPSHEGATTGLHIDKDRPVIGYVGAFEYFIDLDLVLDAAARLPDCSFLLVGAGREFNRIKECVASMKLQNVILTGAVPHRQAIRFIVEMDICLSPFKHGDVGDAASPIKLFEYIACAKPVITTRVKETQRVDASPGFLFYADDATELVETIEFILHHPEEGKIRVRRGSAIMVQHHTWAAIADRFIEAADRTLRSA